MAMLPKFVRLSQNVRRIASFAFAATALAALAPACLSAQAVSQLALTPVASRLTQPINDSARVTLKGTVHPLANAANDRGAAPDSMQVPRIHVMLRRSDAQEASLKQLIAAMHTPGSSSYHKWLTPTQFGEQFGPSDQDIATVEGWLQSKGFSVTKVNPGKQTLEIAGTVGQLRDAFHTQIHKYSVDGQVRYANSTDPQIPAALAPVFGGFVSLNNFHAKRQSQVLGKATYNPKTDKATPQWTQGDSSGVSFVLAPGDFNVQYDLNPVYAAGVNGTNQAIAIVNDSNINIDLVNQYRTLFGLPANPPQVIIDGNDPGVDGTNNPDGPNGDSGEAYLDVEVAGAVAPNATVDLVIGADTALESGLNLALEHAVYGNVAPILSISFGFGCEEELGTGNSFINNIWEQAAAQGITAIVSAGDSGSAGCDSDSSEYAAKGIGVSGLASTPYNVAVGGTDFYYSNYANTAALNTQIATYWNTTPSQSPAVSLLQVIPEQPWNNSQFGLDATSFYTDIENSTETTIGGGSGGASSCSSGTADPTTGEFDTCTGGYAKPSWQTGTGVPADNVRDIPDLSLFAANGLNYSYYPTCETDGDCQAASGSNLVQITGIGGTSASAPAFAGIMALVNQKYGPQGQADFVLYPLATQFPAAFHDVTVGTNSVPCNIGTTSAGLAPLDCIAVTDPLTATDSTYGTAAEGQLGSGTTPSYNATAGYDLATGLGTLDVNQLITNWGSVKFASSTTTLTPSSTSFTHGTSITVSGSVTPASGTATGSVALATDSTETAQQGQTVFPLTSGSFSGSVNFLPGGTYNIWGQYSGDGTNGASTSQKTQVTVNPEASGIFFNVLSPASSTLTPGNYGIISSGTTNIPYGTQLVLSAEIAPSSQLTAFENCQTSTTATCPSFEAPTGTVTFSDGSSAINTAVVNAEGDAEFNSAFKVGSHSVTASYPGDQSYNASTASAVTFSVVTATPQIFATASNVNANGQVVLGQQTILTVLVENTGAVTGLAVAPTGTVTLSGAPSGTPTSATLAPAVDPQTGAPDGVATFVIPASASAGTSTVTISYGGDADYSSTSAGPLQIPFVAAGAGTTSTTSVTATPANTSPNAGIAATVTVTGVSGKAAPTGSVDFTSSGTDLGSITLPSATGDSVTLSVTLNSQILFQGTNLISVQYSGDSNYLPSVGTVTLTNPLTDFTMVPQATIVSIPSSGSATDIVNLSSTNGFSGAVNFTCTGTGGVLCTPSSTSTSLTSGSGSVTLTLSNANVLAIGNYNVILTGTDSTGEYVHTIGLSVTAPATALAPGLTLTGPTGLTIQNPGDSAIGTLSVSPQGGLTGSTQFDCNINGSPAGISCSAPATAANATTSTLTVATAASVVAGSYTAVITATQGTVSSQPLSIPITVSPTAGIALTAGGAITVAPGATTGNTSTITVTPTNFTGSVNLACSLTTSPSGATNVPTCSIPAVNITSGAATATLTVSTTAATSSALQRPLDKLFALGGGVAVAGLLLFGIPARRRSWRTILGMLVFVVIVGMGIGCGGGGSSTGGSGGSGGSGGGSPGTTAGAYVVTVTGTDAATGKITGSTTVNVTVN
jgi:hypothetical protein